MRRAKGEGRAWLRALGNEALPSGFRLGQRRYRLEGVYKHDFFAATARYVGAGGERVVLKLGRRAPLFGLPMGWLGRLVTWNESRALAKLGDLNLVPRLVSRPGPRALVRAFVEGATLGSGVPVPGDFFVRLGEGLDLLHARGWAYVDLEKPQNVIVGEDGRPYLCDFQISWSWPRYLGGGLPPFAWWLRVLQRADRYHLLKLERRVRPGAMSPENLALSRRRPLPIRVHALLTRPFQRVRRGLLNRLEPRRSRGERGRDHGTLLEYPRAEGLVCLPEKRT